MEAIKELNEWKIVQFSTHHKNDHDGKIFKKLSIFSINFQLESKTENMDHELLRSNNR